MDDVSSPLPITFSRRKSGDWRLTRSRPLARSPCDLWLRHIPFAASQAAQVFATTSKGKIVDVRSFGGGTWQKSGRTSGGLPANELEDSENQEAEADTPDQAVGHREADQSGPSKL